MTTQTAPTGTDTAQQPSSKPLTEAEMRAYMATINPEQVRATLLAEQRDAECIKMFATVLAFAIEQGFFGAEQSGDLAVTLDVGAGSGEFSRL